MTFEANSLSCPKQGRIAYLFNTYHIYKVKQKKCQVTPSQLTHKTLSPPPLRVGITSLSLKRKPHTTIVPDTCPKVELLWIKINQPAAVALPLEKWMENPYLNQTHKVNVNLLYE